MECKNGKTGRFGGRNRRKFCFMGDRKDLQRSFRNHQFPGWPGAECSDERLYDI